MIKIVKPSPVLVVDDMADVHMAVSGILRRAGCTVTCVASGEACLETVRAGFRGLILMDIEMPGLDGWATIRAILEQGLMEGNLVCMLTTRPTPGEEAEGLQEYVLDYLPKPFDSKQLLSVAQWAADSLRAAPGQAPETP